MCFILFGTSIFLVLLIGLKVYNTVKERWCDSKVCLVGKTVIVTGANTGIGFETALEFAKRGARVILACQNEGRATEAKERIVKATNNENVVISLVNLSSLQSVRNFAKNIAETEERLDILVNNTGASSLDHIKTENGLPLLMQVNYFGPTLLTILLIDLLRKSAPSRIINVSSMTANYANLTPENLDKYPETYRSYNNSKLGTILFTMKLANLLESSNVSVFSLHPGTVKTEIFRGFPALFRLVFDPIMTFYFKTPEAGAQTTLYAALEQGIEHRTGQHLEECSFIPTYKTARNPELEKTIWDKTMKLIECEDEPEGTDKLRPNMGFIGIIIYLIVGLLISLKVRNKVKERWCKSKLCLVGKTGANTGIGYETALELAKRGARVILACQNEGRATEAKERIVKATENKNVAVKLVNFSSLKSVRNFAKDVIETEKRLDILVNNAGAGGLDPKMTEDGLQLQMQVNYFGPTLLTILLIDLLKRSATTKRANLTPENLNVYPGPLQNYNNSKLGNILFTLKLAKMLESSNVSVFSVHPGTIKTEIFRRLPPLVRMITDPIISFYFKAPEAGAQTTLYAALEQGIEHYSGQHLEDCSFVPTYKVARNLDLVETIWNKTMELVKCEDALK
ncbi:hypothetical protein JTB14_018143 [Gonioctena quinquepunctata]|nr:hypothetical protein JTB14_018143 [Gonioctena quinquepunctata]